MKPADPSAKNSFNAAAGDISRAICAVRAKDFKTLEAMYAKDPAFINWKNPFAQSAPEDEDAPLLCHAARLVDPDVLLWLINKGADLEATGGHNDAPALFFAATYGRFANVYLLVRAGADMNAQSKRYQDRTALSMARERGHETIVRFLEEGIGDVPLFATLDRALRVPRRRQAPPFS